MRALRTISPQHAGASKADERRRIRGGRSGCGARCMDALGIVGCTESRYAGFTAWNACREPDWRLFGWDGRRGSREPLAPHAGSAPLHRHGFPGRADDVLDLLRGSREPAVESGIWM